MAAYSDIDLFVHSREYQLALPRKEVEEVNNLRDRWKNLMDLADQVSAFLLFTKLLEMLNPDVFRNKTSFLFSLFKRTSNWNSNGNFHWKLAKIPKETNWNSNRNLNFSIRIR